MLMLKRTHGHVVASYETRLGKLNDIVFVKDENLGILRRQLATTTAELVEAKAELTELRAAKAKRIANLAAANERRAKAKT